MQDFEKRWRDHFGWRARTYDSDAKAAAYSDKGVAVRKRVFFELLRTLNHPTNAAVLDLGCGVGIYVRALKERGHDVVGLDFSLPSLARAMSVDPDGAWFVAGEAYALPFAAASFDLVVSFGVAQYLERPEAMVREMSRVLRPGGLALLETLNGHSALAVARRATDLLAGRSSPYRIYGPREVETWLKAGGFELARKAGVYLLPRRLSLLETLFLSPSVTGVLNRHTWVGEVFAHALFFVGQKRSTQGETPRG